MAREPSFPRDASIGASPEPASSSAPKDAPAPDPAPASGDTKSGDSRRTKHIVAGAAIGIGSAAIVAALLYANRTRRTDKS